MNAKQFAFMVSIAVLFALFIGLAIDAFYPAPKYQDYCNESEYYGRYSYPAKPYPDAQPNCTINYTLQQQIEYNCSTQEKGFVRYQYDEKGCVILDSAKCDTCNVKFEKITNVYNRNVFYITFTAGIIALISGILISEILGAGFMFGGVLVAFYGIIRYFSELGKILRVVVVFVALAILIYFGKKRFDASDKDNRNKKR